VSTATCPSCGAGYEIGAAFCEACGADLAGVGPRGPVPAGPDRMTGTASDGMTRTAPAASDGITGTAPAAPAGPDGMTGTAPAAPAGPDGLTAPSAPDGMTGTAPGPHSPASGSPARSAPDDPTGTWPSEPGSGSAVAPGAEPGSAAAVAPTGGPAVTTQSGQHPSGEAAPGSRSVIDAESPRPAGAARPTPLPASGAAPGAAAWPDPAGTEPPQRPAAGQESPLDVGWTGVVVGAPSPYEQDPVAAVPECTRCGAGNYVDGYCDHCGAKRPNPRDRFEESPATWVAGVCDIGRRHTRNEDGMSLSADPEPGRRAVLVVCDGVSNTTDSDVASLAAARAARAVLDKPLGAGMGLRESMVAAAVNRLSEAAAAGNAAVVATLVKEDDPTPPSCTFAAAIISNGLAVAGNVGDSRVYWIPDGVGGAEQLSRDDSFAADRIASGVGRKEAETGPMAHSITRWFGADAPDDLTPHTRDLDVRGPGWLLVCSDGLWNYCSSADALQELVARLVAEGAKGPAALAAALVDFANRSGGADNITAALARVEA
jgi:serine/threonine protein phosphatase PrpC